MAINYSDPAFQRILQRKNAMKPRKPPIGLQLRPRASWSLDSWDFSLV